MLPTCYQTGGVLIGFLRSERLIASPYYGLGNNSIYDQALEESEGQYYYRFGRSRTKVAMNLQRPLEGSPVRILFGGGVTRTSVEPLPENATRTLLSTEFPENAPGGWSNYLRAGVVWDTRDRETGPHRGTWSEFLVRLFPRSWAVSHSTSVGLWPIGDIFRWATG